MEATLADRFQKLTRAIGRRACLIAVSKTQTVGAVSELYALGQMDFGENYAQELSEKAASLQSRGLRDIRWHFIGHLQTNKIKAVLPWVSSVHSVDSLKLATALSKQWAVLAKPQPLSIFIEVNLAGEPTKAGVPPGAVRALCEQIVSSCPALRLEGLMCIPETALDSRPAFARLRQLEVTCRPYTQGGLSMGMSSDFELAIDEGATHVRVGTSLFGPRTTSPK